MLKNDVIHYNLAQALTGSTCPVCRCIAEATNRFLDNLMYEFVNDDRTRERLRATKGFCREHAWALQKMGDPLGHSILYADLIDSFLIHLGKKGLIGKHNSAAFVSGKEDHCLACREEKEMEQRYIFGLLRALNDGEFREQYRSSAGLCLTHYQLAERQATDGDLRATLREVQIDCLTKLSAELKEFIRKSDYRNVGEPPGQERDAWIRAVGLWVGMLNLEKEQRPTYHKKRELV